MPTGTESHYTFDVPDIAGGAGNVIRVKRLTALGELAIGVFARREKWVLALRMNRKIATSWFCWKLRMIVGIAR